MVPLSPRAALAGGGSEEDNYGDKWYEPGYEDWDKDGGKTLFDFLGEFDNTTNRFVSENITVLRIPSAVSPGYNAWLQSKVVALGHPDRANNATYKDTMPGLSDAELAEYCAASNNMEITTISGVERESPSGRHGINCAIFKRVPNLRELYIPKSIIHIGSYVFYGCNNLTDIWYGGSRAQWESAIEGRDLKLRSGVRIHYDSAGEKTSAPRDLMESPRTGTLTCTSPRLSTTVRPSGPR